MTEDELIEALKAAVIGGDAGQSVRLARQIVEQKMDPVKALEKGLKAGITEVGEGFACQDLFLPDLIRAADTMQAAAAILSEEISSLGLERIGVGKVLLGTVAGDLHDIGKAIVGVLLASHGFEVIDLGVDVPREGFVTAVKAERPQILGMSSLLTTTAKELGEVIGALEAAGLRDSVRVIVGGGAVTEEYAERIGADGYGQDAEQGVRVAKRLLGI